MSVTLLVFAKRKPGISLAEFKDYYENKHIPWVAELLGSHAPDFHKRSYIDRENKDRYVAGYADGGIEYDVVGEIRFPDQKAYETTLAKFAEPGIAEAIAKDEENLFDRAAGKVVQVDVASGLASAADKH